MREGLATAVASRQVAAILVAATAAVCAAIGLANALDVSRLAAQERQWINAGAYVFVVEQNPDSDGGLDVATCERLRSVDGINGAFAVSLTDLAARSASAPGSSASVADVSPGIYGFFEIDPDAHGGVIIGPGVIDQTALRADDNTILTVAAFDGTGWGKTTTTTVTTITSPILAESIAGGYLFPDLLQGTAQQCYVSTDAAHVEYVREYLPAALGDDRPAIVRPRLSNNTYGLDFATAYQGRTLGWAWAVGAAVLLTLWAILRNARRAQTAVYATFGVRRRARLTMQLTEWLTTTGIGVAWGWAIAVAFALGLGADVTISLTQITFQIAAAWCLASIGVLVIALLPVGTLIDMLKERT